jgi:glutamate-5-semialdehyde dehydrogenase
MPDRIDLVIPRGGEGLIRRVAGEAKMPVLKHFQGNCHVYVDSDVDEAMAVSVVVNAKAQRPGVCNAAETLLVHADVASSLLPGLVDDLSAAGVVLRGDARARTAAGRAGDRVGEATDSDWAEEFLALELAVGVVDTVGEAIEHVNRYGSGHSEAIVTRDRDAARAFQLGVDAACVYVNASTRFTDGGQFGMGAEIGNSTQKLHARGPIGVRELCTFKYLIEGDGQVRA